MHILILDDKLDKARSMAEDVAYLSDKQIQADVVQTEKDAERFILKRRDEKQPAYGALLIDERLGEGEEGIAVMKRLLSESPESEAMLFTAHDDAQVGLRALQAGALHYFDRTEYSTEELILRLNEIRALHEFDEVLILANAARTMGETAQMIVESGRRLGFERARLWRCHFDKSGEVSLFEGWTQSGNSGLDTFSMVKMPVEKSWYVPLLLAHPHDIRVFEGEPADGIRSSYLVSQFGSSGYSASLGEWASLRLHWGGATRAVLMLDNAIHADHVIEIAQQKLLLRFASSAASVLARAAAMDEQMRSQAMAKRVVELVADKDIDIALREIADQLCKDDPTIASTKLKIVLKNEQAGTADYRCVWGVSEFERSYRHSLDRTYLVPFLLNSEWGEPLLLPDASSLHNFRETHNILKVGKPSFSFVYVPMRLGNKVTGALVLDNDVDETIHYSEDQKNRLKSMADEIAAGVEAGRMRQVAERNSIRRHTLIQVRKAIEDGVKNDEDHISTWHLILTALTAGYGIGFNRACLFLTDKGGGLVTKTGIGFCKIEETLALWNKLNPNHSESFDLSVYRATRAYSDAVTPLETFARSKRRYFDCTALSNGMLDTKKITAEIAKSELPQSFVQFIGVTDCALIPVRAGDHILGVVYVDNHAEENSITWESLEEARALISYAAQVFLSQREREQRIGLIELSNMGFDDGMIKKNLQLICDKALMLTDADFVVIYPMQPGNLPEEMVNYDNGTCAVASGTLNAKITEYLPKFLPDGLTHYVLSKKQLVVKNAKEFFGRVFREVSLAEHPLVRDQKLKGLISVSLYDEFQKNSYGVLHLGYRHLSEDISHEADQASFLGRIARRAIRSDWWRKNENLLRGAEADAHRDIMELSLSAGATEDRIAELAAVKMRELLRKERVNQESTVALLKWQPATETEGAQRYRVDYQIKTPDFQSIRRDRLDDPNLKDDKVYFGITGKALKQSNPVYVRDVNELVNDNVYYRVNPDTRCELALRLTSKEGEPIGVLNVESDTVGVFDSDFNEAVNILERLARTLVNALENVRRQRRSERVLKTFQEIVAPVDMKGTLQKVIKAARDIAEGVTTVTIWYVDSDNRDRLFFENWGRFPELVENYEPEPDGSIRREKAIYISKILDHPEERFLSDANKQNPPSDYVEMYGIVSTVHLPLVVEEEGKPKETIGVMFLNFHDHQIFTDEDRTLYRTLASIAAASIRDVNIASERVRNTILASHLVSMHDIAHALSPCIYAMETRVNLLKDGVRGDDLLECIETLYMEINKIKDGLPASRSQPDSNLYSLKLVEIENIVNDLSEKRRESQRIDVTFNLPPHISIRANLSYLRSAITYLWNNSVKPQHKVKHIHVRISQKGVADGMICIEIADDGIGIPPEIAKQIVRGPVWSNNTNDRSQSGMGLLYARKLIETMGGNLKYLGAYPNKGTVFGIELALYELREDDENV